MKPIIVYRTDNMTPHREWDYVAHFEGECADYEHKEMYGYGASHQEALKCFMQDLVECE